MTKRSLPAVGRWVIGTVFAAGLFTVGLPTVGLSAGAALAQTEKPGYSIEDVTACSPDAMRLCRDKIPDLNAIQDCMKAHYEKLRPACKARFDVAR